MPTSLCTGIAGFLGSHVADELIRLGHKVAGVDDLSGGFVENIPRIRSGNEESLFQSEWTSLRFL